MSNQTDYSLLNIFSHALCRSFPSFWYWVKMKTNVKEWSFRLESESLYLPHIQGLFCFNICTCTNKGKTKVNKVKWQNKHAKFLFISLVFNKWINPHRNYMLYKVRRLVTVCTFHSKQWLTWPTQWRIQNFPEAGAPTLHGGVNIRYC